MGGSPYLSKLFLPEQMVQTRIPVIRTNACDIAEWIPMKIRETKRVWKGQIEGLVVAPATRQASRA